MYKRCVTEQSARRQRELEQGLLEVMSTRPYEDISVSDLCDRLQIPRKSFYRYFTSKDGALYALIDHTLVDCMQFAATFHTKEHQATFQVLEHFFDFWKQQKPLLDALARSGMSGLLGQRSMEQAMQEGVIARRLLPFSKQDAQDYVIMFITVGLMSLVIQWHYNGFQEPSSQMAGIAAHLLTQPLFSSPPPYQ